MVSKKWTLQLGDIKGAFLEAGPLDKKFTPLFAHQPKGGVPGLDPEDVIEVVGNVYGANDAPMNWYSTFDTEVKQGKWQQSQFDPCLYYLRDGDGQLCGVLGAHVDDTITAGHGSVYQEAITKLKARFPYRKWRVGNGEFCGVQYRQDPDPVTYEITFGQKEYAEHLRPINLSKDRLRNKDAPATDREAFEPKESCASGPTSPPHHGKRSLQQRGHGEVPKEDLSQAFGREQTEGSCELHCRGAFRRCQGDIGGGGDSGDLSLFRRR
eukprot:s4427_g2.t5